MSARSATPTSRDVPAFAHDRLSHGWLALKGLSDAGDVLWTISLTWTAVQIASPATAGLVVTAGAVPRAAMLLVGGALADRLDPLRTMAITNVARVLVLVVVMAWALTTEPTVPLLVAAAVAFGLSDAAFDPAASTVGRQLVRPGDLPSYAGLSQTFSRVGAMGGSAAGGVVVAAWGIGGSAGINAVTFAAVALFLAFRLKTRFPLPRARSETVLRSVRHGLGYLRATPPVRSLVLALLGPNLYVVPALGIGLALRSQQDGWGAGVLGFCVGLVGFGAAVSSMAVMRWRPRREALVGVGWLVVQGLAIIALGRGPIWVAAAACVVIGITAGIASVLLSAVLQSTVDGAYLGRTTSLVRLGDDVLMPAATALFGLLAAATSVSTAFTVAGVAMVVTVSRTLLDPSLRELSTRFRHEAGG